MWAIISIISTGHRWEHGWLSESLPLGLCSPTFLPLQSSSNSPFLPSLPHSCEEHKDSEHCERPSSTTSFASNPKYISMLTAEMSKYSFTTCPLLWVKVSNGAWTSMHTPAQTMLPKHVHAYAVGLLGPILYRASAFYMMPIHVSTSHFPLHTH